MARLLQGTFVVILACFAVGHASAQATFGGDWIGGFNVAERIRGGHLRFPTESTGKIVFVGMTEYGKPEQMAGSFGTLDGRRVEFELTGGAKTLHCDGELRGDALSGTFTGPDIQGTFEFFRDASSKPSALTKYAGSYRFDACFHSYKIIFHVEELRRRVSTGTK